MDKFQFRWKEELPSFNFAKKSIYLKKLSTFYFSNEVVLFLFFGNTCLFWLKIIKYQFLSKIYINRFFLSLKISNTDFKEKATNTDFSQD